MKCYQERHFITVLPTDKWCVSVTLGQPDQGDKSEPQSFKREPLAWCASIKLTYSGAQVGAWRAGYYKEDLRYKSEFYTLRLYPTKSRPVFDLPQTLTKVSHYRTMMMRWQREYDAKSMWKRSVYRTGPDGAADLRVLMTLWIKDRQQREALIRPW
jgi:hypothetical protein